MAHRYNYQMLEDWIHRWNPSDALMDSVYALDVDSIDFLRITKNKRGYFAIKLSDDKYLVEPNENYIWDVSSLEIWASSEISKVTVIGSINKEIVLNHNPDAPWVRGEDF